MILRFSIFLILTLILSSCHQHGNCRCRTASSRTNLKGIAQAFAIYYDGDIEPEKFPQVYKPEDFHINENILKNPKNGRPYLPVWKLGDVFEGKPGKALFIEDPNLPREGKVLAVYEDTSVRSITVVEAQQLLIER